MLFLQYSPAAARVSEAEATQAQRASGCRKPFRSGTRVQIRRTTRSEEPSDDHHEHRPTADPQAPGEHFSHHHGHPGRGEARRRQRAAGHRQGAGHAVRRQRAAGHRQGAGHAVRRQRHRAVARRRRVTREARPEALGAGNPRFSWGASEEAATALVDCFFRPFLRSLTN